MKVTWLGSGDLGGAASWRPLIAGTYVSRIE